MFCRCGCKGWCTVFIVCYFLLWGARALKLGRFPEQLLDGTILDDSHGERGVKAGTALGFMGALIYFMADWEAVCSVLALWQIKDRSIIAANDIDVDELPAAAPFTAPARRKSNCQEGKPMPFLKRQGLKRRRAARRTKLRDLKKQQKAKKKQKERVLEELCS